MNRLTHTAVEVGIIAALAVGPIAISSATQPVPAAQPTAAVGSAEHVAEATKYELEATNLEAKAKYHAQMAANFRALSSSPGSKQSISYFSMANHCELLAKHYHDAALEARKLSEESREMSR